MNLHRAIRDRRHARLLLAARRGDAVAFRRLYREVFDPVAHYLRARVPRVEDAEDLTAEVFHRFVERLDRYDPKKGSVLAWLLTSAHHALVDHYRARRPALPVEDLAEVLAGRPEGPLEDLVRDEQARLVRRLLDRQTPDVRNMFALRFEHDLRYAEIAACLGLSEAAVKQRFSRALRRLRASLSERRLEDGEVDYAI